jgi:hypothetical protein
LNSRSLVARTLSVGRREQGVDTTGRSIGGGELGQARKGKEEREDGDTDSGRQSAQERVARTREDADEQREPDHGHRDHV